MTQRGVEESQDLFMPTAKRQRTSGRSVSKAKSRTTNRNRVWPKADGWGKQFDPFPAKMSCIMRYNECVNFDADVATPAPYLFRANSIFDPNFSGVGHQPYGHDTYQLIYNHYRVDKAIITISPASGGSNSIIGCTLCDDSTVQGNFDTIKEVKGTKMLALANGEGLSKQLQVTYNRNGTFNQMHVSDDGALYGANPAEQVFFHVWQTGNLPTNNPTAVALMISITYFVTFWEIRDLGQS